MTSFRHFQQQTSSWGIATGCLEPFMVSVSSVFRLAKKLSVTALSQRQGEKSACDGKMDDAAIIESSSKKHIARRREMGGEVPCYHRPPLSST